MNILILVEPNDQAKNSINIQIKKTFQQYFACMRCQSELSLDIYLAVTVHSDSNKTFIMLNLHQKAKTL